MEADRVNFTFGMKVPGVEQYSSISFSSSLTSDRKPDETVEQAFERVREIVLAQVDKDFEAYG